MEDWTMSSRLPYFQYTSRSRLDKSINTLLGLVEGIAIDGRISDAERGYLHAWAEEHAEVARLHPFAELLPVLQSVVEDGVIDPEEREDLRWLCEKLRSSEYYDKATGDLQRLQAVLGGIAADAQIEAAELRALREWIDEHEHLRTLWPFDEVSSLISGVLQDGVIDSAEHELLRAFFGEFLSTEQHRAAQGGMVSGLHAAGGVFASCPEIEFGGMKFCFTGESTRASREELSATVVRLGGSVVSGVSGKVDFLIVGADGNPCWAYACYGRKIEKAMTLRREGARILIVHENDFHDAVADRG